MRQLVMTIACQAMFREHFSPKHCFVASYVQKHHLIKIDCQLIRGCAPRLLCIGFTTKGNTLFKILTSPLLWVATKGF